MHLEPATAAHADALAALALRRCPRLPAGAGVRELLDRFTVHALVCALDDGRLLGWASLAARPGMPAGYRVARVYVDRSAEGRGVGGALAARLRDAVDAEATKVRNRMFDDDPRSLAIARHWGLEVEQHSLTSSMPIADTARPDPPAGVSLEDCPTLSFPDAGAVEAMLLASQTNPEAMRGLRFTLEGLRTFVSPTDTPVGVLARVSGRPAALSFGARRDEVLHFSYTGVGPTHRGRGLARLVKQHAHWRAATLGATVAVTDNEEHNTGIRHVNQRLGYRVDHGVFWLNADV